MMSSARDSAAVLIVAIATANQLAHAETTISGYLGNSWTRSGDLTISQPVTNSDATFQDVGWDSKSFESPPYYGLRLTHFIDAYPSWCSGWSCAMRLAIPPSVIGIFGAKQDDSSTCSS